MALLKDHHLAPLHALDAAELAELLHRHSACAFLEDAEVSFLHHSFQLVAFGVLEVLCELQARMGFEAVEREVDVAVEKFADREVGIERLA